MYNYLKYKFKSIRYIQDRMLPYNTEFSIRLEINDNGDQEGDDVVGIFSKMDMFVEHVLDNSVIFDYSNIQALHSITDDDGKIAFDIVPINVWEDPVDLVLAHCILSKFNALAGDSIDVRSIHISSDAEKAEVEIFTDDLEAFDIPTITEVYGEFSTTNTYWWQRSDGSCLDMPGSEFQFVGIEFDDIFDMTEEELLSELKKDSKDAKVVKFKPRIIKGGKDED